MFGFDVILALRFQIAAQKTKNVRGVWLHAKIYMLLNIISS